MTRILTASVIIALLIGALLSPPWVFFVAVTGVLLLGWREYARLAASIGAAPVSAPGALAALACALAFASNRPEAPLLTVLLSALLLSLAALRDQYRDPAGLIRALSSTLAGVLWIGLLLGAQIGVRMQSGGSRWLILLYASVAVGDSAAYYGGTALGRHRLAPELSPNKSIEGSLFGLAGSALAAAVVANWIPAIGGAQAAVLGVVLGAFGQVGDLLESSFKRAAGTKDSSSLLPGHGGVLDRIDAHLLAGGALWIALISGWLP